MNDCNVFIFDHPLIQHKISLLRDKLTTTKDFRELVNEVSLLMAYEVLRQEQIIHPDVEPLLIVMTDGAGNVSIGTLPPQEESYSFAEQIADRNYRTVVINMEHASFDQGLAQALADHLEAPCYTLNELKAESLLNTVRQEMAEPKKK